MGFLNINDPKYHIICIGTEEECVMAGKELGCTVQSILDSAPEDRNIILGKARKRWKTLRDFNVKNVN